jgi:hypothetical protein
MRLPTEAETLQASAVIVAAPRYCGAFAAAIGIDILSYWPGFAHVEIASGAAMAVLEGWAIAFMFRRWGAMSPGSARWRVLLALQIALMVMLPMVATPYLISAQLAAPVSSFMSLSAVWVWSFVVAAVAPLILAAVGYADVPQPAKQPAKHPQMAVTQQDKPPAKAPAKPAKQPPKKMTTDQRRAVILANRDKTQSELAEMTGASVRTIARDIGQLNGAYK